MSPRQYGTTVSHSSYTWLEENHDEYQHQFLHVVD